MSFISNSKPRLEWQAFSSFSELEPERDRWDELAILLGSPIYLSFDWCRLWWQFYGGHRDLALFKILADGELAGFLPLYIDSFGPRPFGIRMLRLVGAAFGPTRVFDPPLRPDIASRTVRLIIEDLFRRKLCDVVQFGPVTERYAGLTDLGSLADGATFRVQRKPAGVLTFFDLSSQPDDYLVSLGGHEQRKCRHDFRYLSQRGAAVTMVLGPAPDIEAEFRDFARLHTEYWESRCRLGHFRAWAKAYEFHLALAKCMAGLDRLRLLKIRTDQSAILYDYNFVFGRAYFGELRARSLDSLWSKISLGNCALISTLRYAVKEQRTCLYAGVGRNEYEARLGAEECPVVTITAFPRTRIGRFRASALSLLISLVGLLYFKIWYMRLQPKLPRVLRRPIWRFWSRIST